MDRFPLPDIADLLYAGLSRAAAQTELEQAVRGLDSRAELSLHPLFAEALREGGYGVFAEERYPHARARARKSAGRRCDLVLTEDDAPLETAADLERALFLEVKIAAEHVRLGKASRYRDVLARAATEDVVKLCSDVGIHHAALLVVLFTAEAETGERDLARAGGRFLDEGLPVGVPCVRSLPLVDRAGNGWATLGLFPVGTLRRGLFP